MFKEKYMDKKARVIAYYLPQYHPIPENDKWWGKGFTEWRNVAKAKPLFKGHDQPRIPADLGYYDLRMTEVREEQARLAQEVGIEGFCYWHYWFGRERELLERPFLEVLRSGKPDFPFCLGWANHSWTNKTWTVGQKFVKDSMLMEQTYPGIDDYIVHFNKYLEAFKDDRYIKVDGKLLFVVFSPLQIPDALCFVKTWNSLAKENGLCGFHFVGITSNFEIHTSYYQKNKYKLNYSNVSAATFYNRVLNAGFDAVNSRGSNRAEIAVKSFGKYYFHKILSHFFNINWVAKFDYASICKFLYVEEDKWNNVYPTIIPNWDRSPRSGRKALIWYNSTPELFYKQILRALELIKNKPTEHKIIFLQSWNEWGEGNYMEPDLTYGHGYLEALKKALEY